MADKEESATVAPQANALVLEAPKFDPDKYMHHVEDMELSEKQKIELLRTVWEFSAAFARWGFGVDSVRLLTHALEHGEEDQPETEKEP